MIFPQKNVRFIAINDGVDSAQGDNDFAPLRNIFNEWLVRDTSKKIRAAKRSKGMSGKPITSKHISMDTLARICETLDCGIMDVIELASDEPSTTGGNDNGKTERKNHRERH